MKLFPLPAFFNVILTVIFNFSLFSLISCQRYPEMTLSEIEAARSALSNDLIEKTVTRPNTTNHFEPGKPGGTYSDMITGDPKSFNMLVAEKDGETASVLSPLVQYLADYDVVERKWNIHFTLYFCG